MNRRSFLIHAGKNLGAISAPLVFPQCVTPADAMIQGKPDFSELTQTRLAEQNMTKVSSSREITLFLCGDVMTGRGIDQILPFPSDPQIHESYMKTAIGYVKLAERVVGPLPRKVSFSYIWGDALKEFERIKPDARIINLETAVTQSEDYSWSKGINYRMHPDNIPCITAAKIDCCVLSNNHVLDWGYKGLDETILSLQQARIKIAGAGRDIQAAQVPAILKVPGKGRIVIFALGSPSSGIPYGWAASKCKAGVNFIESMSSQWVDKLAALIRLNKQQGDMIVVSIHWGGNWGYSVPDKHQEFAHQLIDQAGVDVIHGHSSHHPKGLEIYKGKAIIYGCGDFLNDYEGISGHENFRGELGLMYFISWNPDSGSLNRIELTPTKIKNFRVNYCSGEESQWMANMLNREGESFGTRMELNTDNTISVLWS